MNFTLLIRGLALAAAVCSGSAASTQNETVTVFAAASLKDALDDIASTFEQHSGVDVVLSFAASSALARQIEFGAPADIFISASVDWMDHLSARGHIDDDSRFALAGNRLALVGREGAHGPLEISESLNLADLLGGGRLAMALTEAVPAGIYGKTALENLGLWQDVALQVAQTDNVRAALALVSLGAAPLGIVYATDAQAETTVSVIGLFPEDSHPPIRYPVARVSESQNVVADDFLRHLRSDGSRTILTAHGFLPPQS